MDDSLSTLEEIHDRTIIHVDMDCYYAQVEEILNPNLKNKPLGVQQRNSVVTSNYIAREYGIKKMMTIAEAKKLCPQLILVNGEDLTKYKQMSSKIFDILLKYTPLVEKLGLDESFLDVSEIVNERISDCNVNYDYQKVEGCIYQSDESLYYCECGCLKRLTIATHIAKNIRKELYETLKITCCAGIAHNKLLAKLVGNINKPNNQTLLLPRAAEEFMRELGCVKKITGIGIKTELQLNEIGIKTVQDLQDYDINLLKKKFGHEQALKLKELSYGHDLTPVQKTGKPKSIGIEDSCRPMSLRKDVEERFRLLLMRLMNQVFEGDRIPITIKVTIRKYDANKKTSHRETKQANISSSLFKMYQNQIILSDGAEEKLLKIIMKLFERCVELNKPFNITLLGLAFSKFQERKHGSSSIANFLIKKTDLEVQSITNLKSEDFNTKSINSHSTEISNSVDGTFFQKHTPEASSTSSSSSSSSSILVKPMNIDSTTTDTSSDIADFEIEPSPKKTRLGLFIAKRRCIDTSNDYNDIASPSKLRVADLRLNSREGEKDNIVNKTSNNIINNDSHNADIIHFNDDDHHHQDPPRKLTKEHNRHRHHHHHQIETNNETDHKNNVHADASVPMIIENEKQQQTSSSSSSSSTITTNSLGNILCPSGVDPNVFKELPVEMQNELISSWKNSLAVEAKSTNNIKSTTTTTGKSNTLYRYFVKNS